MLALRRQRPKKKLRVYVVSDVGFYAEQAVEKRVNIVLVRHITGTWLSVVMFPLHGLFCSVLLPLCLLLFIYSCDSS
jgi:hypothetical protein